jgi:predicted glycosyltransferase
MSQRILVYAQHLSGVGHYVRTFEIARALASQHEVHWVEGGRPVPHAPCPQLRLVELPRICRGPDGRIGGLDPSQDADALMHLRAARLLEAIEAIRPRVFLIEYFPFSKWELSDELLPAIAAVRANGGRVFCSLRDVVRKTRYERAPGLAYAARVTELLHAELSRA